MLKSQDIVILVKAMLSEDDGRWTYRELADQLNMSVSTVHDGVKRTEDCHLFNVDTRSVMRRNLLELFEHGVRYVFPARRGSVRRGIPTGHASPPLRRHIRQSESLLPVWPHAEGTEKGYALTPLHSTVPDVALRDEKFYEIFCLVDAIREGRAREREIAVDLLRDHIEEA